MDFVVDNTTDKLNLVLEKNSNILSDIILSFYLPRNTFFVDPQMGNQLLEVKKLSDSNIRLSKKYIQNALQWLVDTGRASSIDILVEKDSQDFNRMNIKIVAVQNNGSIITYNTYKSVV